MHEFQFTKFWSVAYVQGDSAWMPNSAARALLGGLQMSVTARPARVSM